MRRTLERQRKLARNCGRAAFLLVLVCGVPCWAADGGAVCVLRNDYAVLSISGDARCQSFVDVATGKDFATQPGVAFASIRKAGNGHEATEASFASDRLTLRFGTTGVEVVLIVRTHPHWFECEVASVTGDDVERLTFARVDLDTGAALSDPFSCCGLALNLKATAREIPGVHAKLAGMDCIAKLGLVGAKAALIGCPPARMRDVLKECVEVSELPKSPASGPWALDAEQNRGSYLLEFKGDLGPSTVDAWIDMARQTGMKQVDFHMGKSMRFGDYTPNPEVYPGGLADVKATVDKLHAAGLQAGFHTYACFIAKDSPWVTPVPNPGLAKKATFTLASPLPTDAKEVPVVEPTKEVSLITGFFVVNSLTLQIDDELITFEGIAAQAPYAFTKCTRGALGTKAAPHAAGAKVYQLKEMFGLFAPSGDSQLMTDVAARTAEVYNKCGFDMIYMDALDGAGVMCDNPEETWHYGARFVAGVLKRAERPPVMEMSALWHHIWSARSRMGAWDSAVRGFKQFTDLHCQANDLLAGCFLPANLGWFSVWSWNGLQPERTNSDDVEYLCAKALAHDNSLSLEFGFTRDVYPNSEHSKRMGALIKQYEELRLANHFPASVRARLAVPGDEFTLEKDSDGQWCFRPVQYLKHKVCGLDGRTDTWRVGNRFGRNPAGLRIEALMASEGYGTSSAVELGSFSDRAEFAVPRKCPGVESEYSVVRDEVPALGSAPCAMLRATSSLDNPKQAWTVLQKTLSQNIDVTNRGLGVWVKGDGQGAVLNVQLRTPEHVSPGMIEHYVPIDFVGWRYVELVEPEWDVLRYDWPYVTTDFSSSFTEKQDFIYQRAAKVHFWVDLSKINTLSLWLTNLPKGKAVECAIAPIKGLPLKPSILRNPSVTLGGHKMTFKTELVGGAYLEYLGPGRCVLYDSLGNSRGPVEVEGEALILDSGENSVGFECVPPDSVNARAVVTVISKGEPFSR